MLVFTDITTKNLGLINPDKLLMIQEIPPLVVLVGGKRLDYKLEQIPQMFYRLSDKHITWVRPNPDIAVREDLKLIFWYGVEAIRVEYDSKEYILEDIERISNAY